MDSRRFKVRVSKKPNGAWEARVKTSWWGYELQREYGSFEDALQAAIDCVEELLELK